MVYDAHWGPRRVALKVLHPSLVGTGRARAQFLLEAQRLQQIAHPSVVKVFAVGELPDGRPYLAMERLEGETLAAVIARGAMSPDLALALFEELARAVSALHAQGLVHRDLKPENVFVVGGRHAVLLDFGIAKDLASPATTTTQEGNVRGTPAYMAPERFFGQPAGIATDIYELALVLYAMLAGRLPWDNPADPEARLAPKPIAGIAEALDVEIRRALSTRVQNRPASADALLAAVRASASAESPEAGETARMRSGAPASALEGASPRRTPSDGAATPNAGGGPTPLAWAPTAPATPQRPRPRARRWPFAVLGVTALAGGIAAWRLRAEETPVPARNTPPSAPISQPAAHDPWNEPANEDATKALPLVEPRATRETYRAEAAAAIARLPASTRVVFTVQLGELRAHDSTAAVLDKLGKDPRIGVLASSLPACVRSLATDAEWLAFGAPALRQSSTGTIVLRGRWRQRDVEACFDSGDFKANVTKDGAKLYRIGDYGWLDFIDEHTAYVSVHSELDAEATHELVMHGAGPAAHVRELVARLPVDRSITLIVDGAAKDDWHDVLPIPTGSDLFGWVRVEKDGLAFDIAVDTHTLAAAKTAEQALTDTVSPVVKTIEVVRDKAIVHARGTVNDLMIGLLSAGVSQ
jgi:serine/threonine protein kinase